MTKEFIANEMKQLQARICNNLELIDGSSKFIEDEWIRAEGGGGRTKIIRKGDLIEKGGVAFSAVHGPVSEVMKKQLGLDGDEFFATGVSIVLHPNNPHVPIIHMNVRYFELNDGTFWFGGGIDLTPHYIVPEQAKLFHSGLKAICDKHHHDFYEKYKNWADDYFFIPHRNETRGIGGIFYDHIGLESGLSKEELLKFCIELGDNFTILYNQQAELGRNRVVSQEEIDWRNIRRGRYVEFNLVNDRGTKFGLLSGGRTESILMSLPANANWEYNLIPDEGTRERETLDLLKKGVDWLSSK
jgi:coproporphyrinogen III oxidase